MSVIVTERTARKLHECTRCLYDIEPGERYLRHALTPNDNEIGNPRWWVLASHLEGECPELVPS